MICTTCAGTGKTVSWDSANKRWVKRNCVDCNGAGAK